MAGIVCIEEHGVVTWANTDVLAKTCQLALFRGFHMFHRQVDTQP